MNQDTPPLAPKVYICEMYISQFYRGREVHSRFSFAVRGSPSFLPRVFRSCFAVRGSPSFVPRVFRSCFAVRGSPSFVPRVFRSCFAVRGSQSFVPRISRSCFAVRAFSFAVRTFSFVLRSSQFVVRGSWWFWNRVGALRRKCAEQSECPVRRVTVDGMF